MGMRRKVEMLKFMNVVAATMTSSLGKEYDVRTNVSGEVVLYEKGTGAYMIYCRFTGGKFVFRRCQDETPFAADEDIKKAWNVLVKRNNAEISAEKLL